MSDTCKHCNINPVLQKADGKFSEFCSQSCRSKFYGKQTAEKRRSTNLQRYGAESVFQNSAIQEKIKKTNQKKFGNAHAASSPQVKEKIKAAWAKYQNGHPLADQSIREKREKTLEEKYGVKHPILHDAIRQKIESTCIARFGVKNASKSDIIKNKISESNQSTEVRAKTIKTCLEKYGVKNYNQQGISDVLEYLDDPAWIQEQVSNLGIAGVAVLLGVSVDTVRGRTKQFSTVLPSKSSFEQQVKDFMESITDCKILSNVKVGTREVDLLLPEYNLAIECNGSYWHSEINGRGKNYHLDKTEICLANNIRLLHIWEHQWNQQQDIVKSRLTAVLQQSKRIYARKCTVKELTGAETSDFFTVNHIQGNAAAAIKIGLYYQEQLVAAMTFSKSRYNKSVDFELVRYAGIKGHNIIGGASKLFAWFVKKYSPASVLSYSDRSFNTGKLYQMLGFEHSHSSPPAYYYTKNYKQFENRVKFQKHKLKDILERFDPALSEWDNMRMNGYDRIWDCGADVWVWSR